MNVSKSKRPGAAKKPYLGMKPRQQTYVVAAFAQKLCDVFNGNADNLSTLGIVVNSVTINLHDKHNLDEPAKGVKTIFFKRNATTSEGNN